MGYLDGLIDGNFKTTTDDTTLYYPDGVLGKGYIIPNLEKKQEIRRYLEYYYSIAICLALFSVGGFFVSVSFLSFPLWISGLSLVAVVAGLTFIAHLVLVEFAKGLTPSQIKLSVSESYENSARSSNSLVLWVSELSALILVVAGVVMATDNQAVWYFRFSGVVNILFFVPASAALGYMIKVKSKK